MWPTNWAKKSVGYTHQQDEEHQKKSNHKINISNFEIAQKIGRVLTTCTTHQEDKEHEEDVSEEVERSKDGLGALEGVPVKVAEDGPEEGEDRVGEGGVVLHGGAEDHVAGLAEGHEDDDEHEPESGQVLAALDQRAGQLGHGLVEADVLEELDPAEEDGHGRRVVRQGGAEGQK